MSFSVVARVFAVLLALLPVMVGCRGGSQSSTPGADASVDSGPATGSESSGDLAELAAMWASMPDWPLVAAPNTVILPSDGTVTVVAVASDSVTLKGTVPALASGTIIVSGGADPFQRVVVDVVTQQESTVVKTTQAALTDAFIQGSFKIADPFGEAGEDTSQPGLLVSWESARLAFGGKKEGPVSVPATLKFKLNDTFAIAPGVTLSGDISVQPIDPELGYIGEAWNGADPTHHKASWIVGARAVFTNGRLAANLGGKIEVNKVFYSKVFPPLTVSLLPPLIIWPVLEASVALSVKAKSGDFLAWTAPGAATAALGWGWAIDATQPSLYSKFDHTLGPWSKTGVLNSAEYSAIVPITIKLSFLPYVPSTNLVPGLFISVTPLKTTAEIKCAPNGAPTSSSVLVPTMSARIRPAIKAGLDLSVFGGKLLNGILKNVAPSKEIEPTGYVSPGIEVTDLVKGPDGKGFNWCNALTPGQFFSRYVALVCDKIFSCCSPTERDNLLTSNFGQILPTAASCAARYQSDAMTEIMEIDGNFAADKFSFNTARAQECLDAMGAVPCVRYNGEDDLDWIFASTQSCREAFVGKQPAGSSCASGLECVSMVCAQGTCASVIPVGGTCDGMQAPCAANATCLPGTPDSICGYPQANGGDCSIDDDCQTGNCVAGSCGDNIGCKNGR